MQDFLTIRFRNWEKFNPRKDIKRPWYFAFDNGFFEDPKLYALSLEERMTLIYLLCVASKCNDNGAAFVSREHYRVHSRVQSRDSDRILSRTIKKLQELRIIEQPRVRGAYADISEDVQQTKEKEEKEERDTNANGTSPGEVAALTPPWLALRWNENCGPLPKLRNPLGLSTKRFKAAEKQLRERPNCDDWVTAIKRMAASPKCQGKQNAKDGPFANWIADFDFLIVAGRLDEILEGKWDGRQQAASAGPHSFWKLPGEANPSNNTNDANVGAIALVSGASKTGGVK